MDKKMSINEFAERLMEQGDFDCYCNATEHPPCGFCESGVDELYEKYLNEEEAK